jgi:DNA modification methylase
MLKASIIQGITADNHAKLIYGQGSARECLSYLSEKHDEPFVDCIVTSPPYFGLRNYCDNDGQLGANQTLDEYIEALVDVLAKARAILKDDGTLWLNLGDSYANQSANRNNISSTYKIGSTQSHGVTSSIPAGLKKKDLIGVPWRVAFALQADGWWLRNDIIWHKPNPMPSSAQDRCTVAHEYIFLLSKSQRYYFNSDAIREPLAASTVADWRLGADRGKRERYGGQASCPSSFAGANPSGANARTVWKLKPNSYHGSHFAVFPEELPKKCIAAGCPPGGLVLDPFSGSGTTGKMALQLKRSYLGIDINADYLDLAKRRVSPLVADVVADDRQIEMFHE